MMPGKLLAWQNGASSSSSGGGAEGMHYVGVAMLYRNLGDRGEGGGACVRGVGCAESVRCWLEAVAFLSEWLIIIITKIL